MCQYVVHYALLCTLSIESTLVSESDSVIIYSQQ